MLLIQILIAGFALYALTRTFLRFRRRTIGPAEWVIWSSFWVAVGTVVLVPNTTQAVARVLGVGRGADAVIYLALVGLSYAFFRIYLRSRNLEQQLTLLVRRLAIEDRKRLDAQKPEPPGAPEREPKG